MNHWAWRALFRLSQCLVLVSIVVVGALAYPAAARADWDGFRTYTYDNWTDCSTVTGKDPINYFFNTTNHDLGVETVAKQYIAGWPVYWGVTTPAGNIQYMYSSDYGCHIQDDQLAQAITGPKYHTRLRQGPWITGWGYATAAPMHHDSLAWCGWFFNEVSDSFNSARNEAYSKFSMAGFMQTRYWVGNTLAMRQCDDRMTASDGYIYENHGY